MNGWGAIHVYRAERQRALLPGPQPRASAFPTCVSNDERSGAFAGVQPLPRRRLDAEPCRSCDDKEKDFGGCRCQALLLTGNSANTDPACRKSHITSWSPGR